MGGVILFLNHTTPHHTHHTQSYMISRSRGKGCGREHTLIRKGAEGRRRDSGINGGMA
jgi:hypothetical protein